jgi:hypothetical protein
LKALWCNIWSVFTKTIMIPSFKIKCHVSIFRNAILLLANFIIVFHRPIRHHLFQCYRNVVRSIFWIYLVSASIVTHLSQQLVGNIFFLPCNYHIILCYVYVVLRTDNGKVSIYFLPQDFPLS